MSTKESNIVGVEYRTNNELIIHCESIIEKLLLLVISASTIAIIVYVISVLKGDTLPAVYLITSLIIMVFVFSMAIGLETYYLFNLSNGEIKYHFKFFIFKKEYLLGNKTTTQGIVSLSKFRMINDRTSALCYTPFILFNNSKRIKILKDFRSSEECNNEAKKLAQLIGLKVYPIEEGYIAKYKIRNNKLLLSYKKKDSKLVHNIKLIGLATLIVIIAIGGIIIGALGVLDDVTTAQSATIDEIHQANPKLSVAELYKRGLSVGREHISSLINTLALAYVGAALPLILIFTQTDFPL